VTFPLKPEKQLAGITMIETDLILSVGTIFAPIIFLTAVYGIMRRSKRRSRTWTFAKRVLEGYIVFWLLYILFPAILNILNPVEDSWKQFTVFQSIGSDSLVTGVLDADLNTFVRYTGQFLANSVALYLFYPFTLFPIIFIVGPLVSFFVLWRQLRKSKGESFLSKLGQIQFALEMSPTEAVGQRLEKADWTEKKKLFFILLAVLPISLYLLMTFLKVLGYQEQSNILKGTSLGWFLEIFFAYLAIAMYGVHLLYAAKISYKGDYVGLRVRDAIFQSLSTVGTFVSAIAIILFLVDYSKQLFVVLYFIGYFVMVTVIFILFLDVFEPVSIYLLTKIIETVKRVGPTGMPVAETVTKDLSQPSMPEVFVPAVNLKELREEQPAASITTPKEEAPVKEEEVPEVPAEEPAPAPVKEAPAEEVNKLDDALAKIGTILQKLDDLAKQDAPVAPVVEEPEVEEPAPAPVKEAPAEEEEPEEIQKISASIEAFGKKVDGVSEKISSFEERIKKLEEQEIPSKVSSPKVVTRGGEPESTPRVEEIKKRLDELEEMKNKNLAKYQEGKYWEEAFSLIAERDELLAKA